METELDLNEDTRIGTIAGAAQAALSEASDAVVELAAEAKAAGADLGKLGREMARALLALRTAALHVDALAHGTEP